MLGKAFYETAKVTASDYYWQFPCDFFGMRATRERTLLGPPLGEQDGKTYYQAFRNKDGVVLSIGKRSFSVLKRRGLCHVDSRGRERPSLRW
jgi:hypothetical protein